MLLYVLWFANGEDRRHRMRQEGTDIAWVEAGYYDSADGAASDPLIRNSELRFLAGFEKEIATELTASIQYNLERKLDYDSI
jgi:hypothetical protein